MSRPSNNVRVRQGLGQVGRKEQVTGKLNKLIRSDNFYLYNFGVAVLFGNRISFFCEIRQFLWFLRHESVKYDST
jgi:hypothetical protein